MLTVKHFKDGNRLVVVFEGDELPGVENVVTSYLGAISTPPAQALPLQKETEQPPSIPFIFEDGPYKGRTPKDVLNSAASKEFEKALIYMGTANVAEEVREVLAEKFKAANPEEYAAKLTEKQIKRFIEVYGPFATNEAKDVLIKELNFPNWTSLLINGDTAAFRRVVAKIIKF